MPASLHVLRSPLAWSDCEHETIEPGATLGELIAARTPHYVPGPVQPVALLVDGAEIPAEDWPVFVVRPGSDIVIVPRPGAIGAIGLYEIFQIILVVAAVYYAATIDVPNIPDQSVLPDPSPTYSLNAQGNRARLGEPIPVRYGRHRIFPDFASEPFREFEGSDQYLYQLFAIGQGSYSYADLKIGETSIGNFSDVEWQFYEPGQTVTLFPADVTTSAEVGGSGLTLFGPNDPSYPGVSGPFVANAVGESAIALAVDVVFPRGVGYANSEGGLDAVSVMLRFQYREIDDTGAPVGLGTWATLSNPTYTLATVDVQRYTVKVAVPAGRYEVRGQRLTNTEDDYRRNDEVRWTGLRAYIDGGQVFNHATWAVKCRASDQLSAQSERRFNLVATRRLPIWTGSAWTAETATRNPAWAFCDALRAEYGGRYTAAHLNLAAIKAVADDWAARGDSFDGQYDTPTVLWSALQQICLAGRAVPYQYGEVFSIIRDDGSPPATYMFNGRNIERGSLSVTYQTMDVWGDDSVEIEYIDPVSWKPQTILCAIPGVTPERPRKIKLFGVTTAKQAHREGMFAAAKMAYRTVVADFTTELDGRVPQYLDGMLVAHEVYRWGAGGEVIAVSGSTLTLSQPADFDGVSDHYVWLRDSVGAAYGPYLVGPVEGQPQRVVSVDTLPGWVYTGHLRERTYYAFARGLVTPRRLLLDQVESADGLKVRLRGVLDDLRAHQYDALVDDGTIVTPTPAEPAGAPDLTIRAVRVVQGGTVAAPALQVSWALAPGALRYFVDVSYDAGDSWQRVYSGEQPQARFPVQVGAVRLRIAAMLDTVGPWYVLDIEAGEAFDVPPTPSGLALTGGAFAGSALEIHWSTDVAAVAWRVDYVLSSTVKFSQTVTNAAARLDAVTARLNGLGREFDVRLYGINANGVPSSVPATLHVKNNQTAALAGVVVTGLLDQIMVEYSSPTELDNDGFRIYASQTSGFTPGPGNLIEPNAKTLIYAFRVGEDETWYVRVAGFDVWGTDELNFAAQQSATGRNITETVIGPDSISTPMLQANSVTANKISVSQLSAISANMGTITAGLLKTDAGSGVRVEIEGGAALPFWLGTGAKTTANSKIYMDSSGNLVARGIVIADASGTVLFGSGTALNVTNISGLGTLATASSVAYSSVTGTKPPANADRTADNTAAGIASQGAFATLSQITSGNASTFIASAAIGSALIYELDVAKITGATASFVSANIATASITTLKLGAHTVSVPVGAYTTGSISVFGPVTVQSVVASNPDAVTAQNALVTAFASFDGTVDGAAPDLVYAWIYRDSTVIFSGTFATRTKVMSDITNGFSSNVSVSVMDTLAGGAAATYSLRLQSGGASGLATNRSIAVAVLAR